MIIYWTEDRSPKMEEKDLSKNFGLLTSVFGQKQKFIETKVAAPEYNSEVLTINKKIKVG